MADERPIPPGRRFTRLCAEVLPAFLVVAGTAVLLFALSQWWAVQNEQLHDRLFEIVLRTGHSEDYFNAKLELLNQRAEDIRTLLVYLMAVAGFVTAAQGLFAYLNVQNYTNRRMQPWINSLTFRKRWKKRRSNPYCGCGRFAAKLRFLPR